MSTRRQIPKKASLKSNFTPPTNPFQSRGFGNGIQARSAQLPTTNLLQTRPFASPYQGLSQPGKTPDMQTQLEKAERFGYNTVNIPVYAKRTPQPNPVLNRLSLLRADGLGGQETVQFKEDAEQALQEQSPTETLEQQPVLEVGEKAVQGKETVQLKPNSSERSKKVKPFTVEGSGDRITLIPKKPNGKTLYFFFGYTGSKKDKEMRDEEAPDLEDDVYRSAAQGFKVVYDKAGNYNDFFGAIYDPNCYGIYWSGHGYMNGNIQSSDGKVIRPEDVDAKKRSPKITYLILAACGSGVGAKRWQKVLGSQCKFEGWVDLTNTSETKDFTSDAWFDSWSSHGGINPNKELADYINDAEKAK
jgi:hypothetical protein